jgi:hypothetical protein
MPKFIRIASRYCCKTSVGDTDLFVGSGKFDLIRIRPPYDAWYRYQSEKVTFLYFIFPDGHKKTSELLVITF